MILIIIKGETSPNLVPLLSDSLTGSVSQLSSVSNSRSEITGERREMGHTTNLTVSFLHLFFD